MRNRLVSSRWASPLLLILFSLPVLQNLWGERLTCGFDNVFHLWRSVQVGALLREGIWFSRWAPHMAHGYGYPLYQFQSPLSAYIAALFQLGGAPWPLAVNLTYGVGFVGSGVATWWLGRTLWGERGGLLAAVALLFAPYHLYVLYNRGSLSETVAWIFPPLVLWGIVIWQAEARRIGMWTAVLTLALLFYTHDVTAYVFLPLFLAWPVVLCLAAGGRWQVAGINEQASVHNLQLKPLLRGWSALLLGLFAASFFWLPSIAERPFIRFGRAIGAWPFLPQNNFLPLDHLFALPRNANPQLINDWPERGLSLVLLILLLVGIGVGLRRGGTARRLTAALTLLLLAYLFIVSSLSGFLWDAIPPLAVFQFPWRFLSPAVLLAALLIGSIASEKVQRAEERERHSSDTATNPPSPPHPVTKQLPVASLPHSLTPSLPHSLTLLLLIPILHFGWLYPGLCQPPQELTVDGMAQWERATGTLGTTATRELLPTTVERLPRENAAVSRRSGRFALPDSVQVVRLDEGVMNEFIEVEAEEPFTAVYRAFAFPGWHATVNGHPVDIIPSEPEGLITFAVPSGSSQLRLFRRSTGIQQLGIALTLLALLGTGFVSKGVDNRLASRKSPEQYSMLTFSSFVFIALIAFSLKQTPLFNQSKTPPAGVLGNVTFGTTAEPALVELVGIEPFATAVAADRPLTVTTYWRALRPLSNSYRVGLTLYDANGVRWSEVGLRDDRWSNGAPPTTAWPTDRIAKSSFYVDALTGTPPGVYNLELTFFDAQSLEPLSAALIEGAAPALSLGQVRVLPPRTPFTESDFGGSEAFATLGDLRYRLLVDREAAIPGDSVLVTLIWNAATTLETVDLALLDETERVVFSQRIVLDVEGRGVWRAQRFMRLPASLHDGAYRWRVSSETADDTAVALQIDAPERIFAQPEVESVVNETLGERVTLVGATVTPNPIIPGRPHTVELVWRGEVEMTESYRVFVQLLDETGQLAAQSDAVPAGWARPTTGWQPGEFIVDVHTLTLPETMPGTEYRLIAGMVGEDGRLLTEAGDDFILLSSYFAR